MVPLTDGVIQIRSVRAGGANMRRGPGTAFAVRSTLSAGHPVTWTQSTGSFRELCNQHGGRWLRLGNAQWVHNSTIT